MINEQFTTTDVMRASGYTVAKFQNLMKSPAFATLNSELTKIESDGIKGKERMWSFYATMTVAVVGALSNVGLPPKKALSLAQRFAHTNDIWDETSRREIGLPCHPRDGDTYLVTNGQQDAVILRLKGDDIDEAFNQAQLLGETGAPARVTLNMSELFGSVMRGLGKDPQAVLDAAYPKEIAD